jgi:prephenate dehydrogenase
MGGSLGLALRARGGWHVAGLARREATLRTARRRGVIDTGSADPARVLPGADVVVYCSPVEKIVPLVKGHRRFLPPHALLMDVGSVKSPIVRDVEKIFHGKNGPVFVGAHPMAGSEKTGVENAQKDLYVGAVCAITPSDQTPWVRVEQAVDFWKSVGARPLVVDPESHDRAVAVVSHLPHLIADALMLSVGEWKGEGGAALLRALAAGSFRGATRVAGADPQLWRGIFRMNDRFVRDAAGLFSRKLSHITRRGWSLADLRRAHTINTKFKEKS